MYDYVLVRNQINHEASKICLDKDAIMLHELTIHERQEGPPASAPADGSGGCGHFAGGGVVVTPGIGFKTREPFKVAFLHCKVVQL